MVPWPKLGTLGGGFMWMHFISSSTEKIDSSTFHQLSINYPSTFHQLSIQPLIPRYFHQPHPPQSPEKCDESLSPVSSPGLVKVWVHWVHHLVQDSAINDDGLCIPQARPELRSFSGSKGLDKEV